jgi:hypothetical protein
MTTHRTAIRRRLAVRGAPHGPPLRRRKPGHHSIVAPLTATLFATLAVGVGVAVARNGRGGDSSGAGAPPGSGKGAAAPRRRRGKRRGRGRGRTQFSLAGDEPLAEAIQRATLEQLDLAISQLGGTAAKPDERAVHETRKALKRLRATMRLLRYELGEPAYRRESRVLAGVAARLSQTRDSEVMVETLEALVKRNPRKLRGRGVKKLRKRLVSERKRARKRGVEDVHTRALALQELRALRSRVATWELRCEEEELLQRGLRRVYRSGRRRGRRAERARRRRRDEAMHEWRKRVKDLRYCAELLQRHTDETAAKGGRLTRLGRVAARADELGELLGEDHDLVLFTHVLEQRSIRKVTGRRTRRLLRKEIDRRRRTLRRRARRRGTLLYRRTPSKFVAAAREQVLAEARAARVPQR